VKSVVPPFQRGEGFGTLGSSFVEPALPEAVSLAPATWGAWLTLALLACAFGWLVTRIARRAARRVHRRAARRELLALRTQWQAAAAEARPRALERLPPLLKGCALASFERRRVAALTGDPWRDFLRQTAPGAGFEGVAGDALVALCQRGASAVDDAVVPSLFSAADAWIARHHV
jgi:Domain of unknown function (DUF4381)